MKEIEVDRMNFLKLRHTSITYKTLLLVMAGCCAFFVAIYFFMFLREVQIRHKIESTKGRIEELNSRKDQQISIVEKLGKEKLGTTVKEDIKAILLTRPHWSVLLKALTKSLPPQVWLDSVALRLDSEKGRVISIKGGAKSQRALTNFIMRMETSGKFKKTELVKTSQSEIFRNVVEYEINSVPVMRN